MDELARGLQDMDSPSEVQRFLSNELGLDAYSVEKVGAGAWSDCYAFVDGTSEFVIRFGNYMGDFEKDRRASTYATPALPIPAVSAVGQLPGGFYAISRRARGTPLEISECWDQLVGPVAAALESMRLTALPAGSGWGPWDRDGSASSGGWRDYLLGVEVDSPASRTHGWRAKLRDTPAAHAAFREGYKALDHLASDSVPRNLIHADLLNKNVHVDHDAITGVFDWGCSIYGDHLYDLAWFEFWAPWLPHVRPEPLREILEQTWDTAGYTVTNTTDRTVACLLHIGLDSLAYNAHLESTETLTGVATRMKDIISSI